MLDQPASEDYEMAPDLRPDLPDGALLPNGLKNQTTSADRLFGRSTIWGKDGDHNTPYMTRYWFGRLRLHIFYRGDQDPDAHDHPWDFWTFPFTSYVEEVVERDGITRDPETGKLTPRYRTVRQIVRAWRRSFRPAQHTHRVLGPYAGFIADSRGRTYPADVDLAMKVCGMDRLYQPCWKLPGDGRIVTLVWRSGKKRGWGFLKNRDGKWCWTPWKEYVFGGGKSAPCE